MYGTGQEKKISLPVLEGMDVLLGTLFHCMLHPVKIKIFPREKGRQSGCLFSRPQLSEGVK